jgi:hypothetical protein
MFYFTFIALQVSFSEQMYFSCVAILIPLYCSGHRNNQRLCSSGRQNVEVEWWVAVGPTEVRLSLEVGHARVSTWVACRKPRICSVLCKAVKKKKPHLPPKLANGDWIAKHWPPKLANGDWIAKHCRWIVTC